MRSSADCHFVAKAPETGDIPPGSPEISSAETRRPSMKTQGSSSPGQPLSSVLVSLAALVLWPMCLLADSPPSSPSLISKSGPTSSGLAANTTRSKLQVELTVPSPVFIENEGQVDPLAAFYIRSPKGTVWLTAQGPVFDVVESNPALHNPRSSSL